MDFSPQSNFAKSSSAAEWTSTVESKLFVDASSSAMLQMQANLGRVSDFNVAAANSFRLEGARQFLSILMLLTKPDPEPIPRPQSGQLKQV